MNFAFTDDQLAFAALVREVLAAEHGVRGDKAWARLAGAGFFGLLVPEAYGGLGLRLVDALPAVEEAGRACVAGPVIDTLVASPYVLGGGELARVAAGELRVAAGAARVADADLADLLVLAGPAGSAAVLSPQSVRLAPHPSADPGRPLFEVEATGTGGVAVPDMWRALTVATAAQLLGLARHLLATSVEYARQRVQFGRPIGSFQAVKHRLADVALAVEFAAPLVWRAALSLGERDVSAAKAASGEAAELAAGSALQVHGAIGYTHELPLRHWLARVWALSAAHGSPAEHRARIRELLPGSANGEGRWP
ncbi:acyl-CoA dehydrogenase family protein [Nonomuraea sp. NPDC050310]|uniref:acyl-CoA dehydrogenase family protein n=1 Tax=Nonomuraea sp. NPDC050310 TaxID=3154935 RepID=UPI0033D9EC60